MDLGLIKSKLQLNCYKDIDEFVKDVNLVFENCITYNGDNSYYGRKAKQHQIEFH